MNEPLTGYFIGRNVPDTIIEKSLIAIDNIEKLPDEGCSYIIFHIDELFDYSWISTVRQKSNYQLIPIFYIGEEDPLLNQISDGIFTESSLESVLAIQEKMILINDFGTNINEFENLLINYAYIRDNFVISCKLNHQELAGFNYPLLKIINPEGDSIDFWHILENMETRKLLIHNMIDEIQSCPHCHSGLLNFKNCCPNCESSKIITQSFVHCFTCGNMAPLSDFLRGHALICNRCHTTLRHIGIDYDKPIEDKICENCKFYFFEASVKALCLVCSKLSLPEDLESRKLYEYCLSSRGQSVAQGIDRAIMIEAAQFLQLTDLSVFMMILSWQLMLFKRNTELQFCLASITITNEDDLAASYGAVKTEKIILEFFERIRALLRDSDLITRDDKVFVFFLPMTPPEQGLALFQRVHSFTKKQLVEKLNIEINITMIHSSELLEKNINIELILNELYNSELKIYE